MYINIITPCSRPENIEKIYQSIDIPLSNYRWIVVFDNTDIPNIPVCCEKYAVKNPESRSGNAQRNFAIDLIKEGYLYFLDDDTLMHPYLWDCVKDFEGYDMIVFPQVLKNDEIRLNGDKIALNHIDSGNFLIKREVVGDLRWNLNRYDADGVFAEQCSKVASSIIYLSKPCSIYNALR